MFRLTNIQELTLDRFDVNEIERYIKDKGVVWTIEYYIKSMVVCPPKILYGFPVNHTKHHTYRSSVSYLNYIFKSRIPTEEISKEDVDDYIELIIDLHERNLKYEKDNPPRLPEPKKKGSRMPKSREPKQPKEPKEVVVKELPKMTLKTDFILKNLKIKK